MRWDFGMTNMKADEKSSEGSRGEGSLPRRYCRGCGLDLPLGSRRHFHKDCLQADKRSRTCQKRLEEQQRLKRWLEKQRCLRCGAKYGDPMET